MLPAYDKLAYLTYYFFQSCPFVMGGQHVFNRFVLQALNIHNGNELNAAPKTTFQQVGRLPSCCVRAYWYLCWRKDLLFDATYLADVVLDLTPWSLESSTHPTWLSTGGLSLCLVLRLRGVWNAMEPTTMILLRQLNYLKRWVNMTTTQLSHYVCFLMCLLLKSKAHHANYFAQKMTLI